MLLAFANNVNPEFYNLILTFWVYTALLIGGMGRVLGPVAGAVVFWFLFQWFEGFMRSSIEEGWYGSLLQDTDAGPFRFMLFGLILMLLVVFRPQGFFGDKEEALLDGSWKLCLLRCLKLLPLMPCLPMPCSQWNPDRVRRSQTRFSPPTGWCVPSARSRLWTLRA